MLISSLCGYLPPASSMSFIIDATGGYPGGIWNSSLLYVTARPATKAPVTGSSLQGVQQRTYRNLCCKWRRLRASLALTDREVALSTEQTRGGARQV